MNIDSKHIRTFQDELKTQLTKKEDMSESVKRLIALHVHRINDGVEFGLRNSRSFYAIDRAYDISQHQITPTLVRDLIDRNPGVEEIQSLVKSWGLDDMLMKVDDVDIATGKKVKGSNPKPGYLLQAPTFFNIFLPLLQSYVKIRWAKLFNDRDVHPLYKYDSLQMGAVDRAIAKVTTQRIQLSASQMGYRMTERDSIQKMLLYGQAINFPREPWHKEEQKIDGEKVVVKEGIRFEIPHPTRVFYDRSHPLYTLNSDTGVEWVGYWTMVRYGDILSNKNYWLPPEARATAKSKKKKDAGTNGISLPSGWRGQDIFTNLYRHLYPCTIAFPVPLHSSNQVSPNERTKSAFLYNGDTLDDGIDITVLFHKLIPSEWGLYDYDHPVWHRFIYAGGSQVLYCEPVFYTPAVAYLYDYDAERARNSSLGFELLPFQDQLGNLLTQHLLSVKKNLIRIVAVNQDVVGKDFQAKALNFAENALRGMEVFEYSATELKDMGSDVSQAFFPVQLQQQTTVEIVGAINNMIGILERLLGYSSQEVGASASHQQSAAEVNIIQGTSTTRMMFTGSFVDDAIYARKRMLYYAMLHYSSDKFMVMIQETSPKSAQILKDKGFEVQQDAETPGLYSVKGSKSNLLFETMFSERDGQSRQSDQGTAQMLQAFLDRLMANPAVGQKLPLKYIFKFFNGVAEYLGLPAELKLPEDVEEQNAEAQAGQQQQLQQMVGQIVEQMIGPPLEQVSQAVGQVATQQQQTDQAVEATSSSMAQNDQAIIQRQDNTEKAVQLLLQKFDQILRGAMAPPPGA